MGDNFKHLLVADEGFGISRVTMNRPGKLNALDLEVMKELCSAFECFGPTRGRPSHNPG